MKKLIYTIAAAITLGAIAVCFVALTNAKNTERADLYIDADDTYDSVLVKVETAAQPRTMLGFKTLALLKGYKDHVRTGRYTVEQGTRMLQLFRNLRNHNEEPINLVVPSVRTVDELMGRVAGKLLTDSLQLQEATQQAMGKFGLTRETLPTLFIPNTYEVYWDIAPEKFVQRMKDEYERFWTKERRAKADTLHLSPFEVATLASIVDAESAYNPEKPRIAGLYINRLQRGMPLQSDPTVIFAVGDFSIRRVLNEHLRCESPYNTYRYEGLPPGPIRIASIAGLDAVLNAERHGYLYMCAKEDFSGSHNFATNYNEHMQNARRYINELNRRGIKR